LQMWTLYDQVFNYFAIYVDSLTFFDDRCFPYKEVDFLDERLCDVSNFW